MHSKSNAGFFLLVSKPKNQEWPYLFIKSKPILQETKINKKNTMSEFGIKYVYIYFKYAGVQCIFLSLCLKLLINN